MIWRFVARVFCVLTRHSTPATFGNRVREDILLGSLAKHPDMTISVSCLCGRRMVPFRARKL